MSDREFEQVLVTGASGFVGGHLAALLVERGYRVRALYRREKMPEQLERLADRGLEPVRLDLAAAAQGGRNADLRRLLDGVDALFHVAARAGDWGPLESYTLQNVDATVNLLDQARDAGCRKFVLTSSIAVHGFGPHHGTPEEGPYYPYVSAYQITKKRAEEIVLSRNGSGIATTAIRPGNVVGPGDTTSMFPYFEAMERGLRGNIGGGKSLTCPVYVGDLAEAHLLALENPAADGLAFDVTGGEEVTWAEYTAYACELLGLPPPWLKLPAGLARALAVLLEGVYGLVRASSRPPFTRYLVDQVSHDYHFSIARARDLLGFKPKVGWREALRLTVKDYREQTGKAA